MFLHLSYGKLLHKLLLIYVYVPIRNELLRSLQMFISKYLQSLHPMSLTSKFDHNLVNFHRQQTFEKKCHG